MIIKIQYYECIECKKQIIRVKQFIMTCPKCGSLMKINKLEIGDSNE